MRVESGRFTPCTSVLVLLSGLAGCADTQTDAAPSMSSVASPEAAVPEAQGAVSASTAEPAPEASPGGGGRPGLVPAGGGPTSSGPEPLPAPSGGTGGVAPAPGASEGEGAAAGRGSTPSPSPSGGAGAGGRGRGGQAPEAGSAGVAGSGTTPAPGPWQPEFQTRTLSNEFVSEGAAVADIDADGVLDLVAGPLWYRGPDFELGGEIAEPTVYPPEQYSLFFLTFAADLNGDDLPDVLAIGDAGGGNGTGTPNAKWYENPGPDALDQHWAERPVYDGLVSNESPIFANLVGDERPELVFMTERQLGHASPGANPDEPWEFHAISGSDFNTPYVHGLGVGDIDGNGLPDVVEAAGYWLQQTDGSFERRAVDFTEGAAGNNRGGAQMLVFDVDGDGDADVVTSLSGHGYGLSWFEQVDGGEFEPHVILPAEGTGESFSQLHALAQGDLNGDGLPDFVTGKRYYAHRPPTDPGGTDPAVIYWFELTRAGGTAEFVPRAIHDDSGVGCNFAIEDIDGNGRLDIVVANKKGNYVHLQ